MSTRPRGHGLTDSQLFDMYVDLGNATAVAEKLGMANASWISTLIRKEKLRRGLDPKWRPTIYEARMAESAAGVSQVIVDESLKIALAQINQKLDKLLKRQADVIEWRPDHRRLKDGGEHVTDQRRDLGLPKRRGGDGR